MRGDETDPDESAPEAEGVDPEILEAALEMLGQGKTPDVASLASRFGDRDGDIVATLEAVHTYRERLADAKEIRQDPDEDVLEPGTALGDYTITGLLGRGAMGVVYRAKQEALGGREVALKVLPSALVARDPRFLDRFRREAQLASEVHAADIAEIYDFGSADGQFFFAMRLVEGPTLAEVLGELARQRRMGQTDHTQVAYVRKAAKLVRDIARALGAVHAAGLVHRDVKPSNLILERSGIEDRTGLAGVPTLVDFGLLRPVNSGASDLTGSVTVLGTPAFAAPEVKLGHAADARSDVFSLGVVLHDLLTLTRPVDRSAASAGLDVVRAVNPAVDPRLSAIVEKAVDEKPALRYGDGEEFANDLDRYLRGDAVRALPTTPWSRLSLWARRSPVAATRVFGLLFLATLVLTALGAYGVWAGGRTALANAAAEYQQAGNLLAAEATWEDLAATRYRWLLPWLRDDFARSTLFNQATGLFREVLDLLHQGERYLEEHDDDRADIEFAQVYDRLSRILLDPRLAELHELARQALAYELTPSFSERRRRRAMDTWTNYLAVLREDRPYPPNLPALLERHIDDHDGCASETREAATAAFGQIPTRRTFSRLIDLFDDHDEDVALRAWHCASDCYAWIHHFRPTEFERIDASLMARWADRHHALFERLRPDLNPRVVGSFSLETPRVAWHVACFERGGGRDGARDTSAGVIEHEALAAAHGAIAAMHEGMLEADGGPVDKGSVTIVDVNPRMHRVLAQTHTKIAQFLRTEPDITNARDDEDAVTYSSIYRFATGLSCLTYLPDVWMPPPESAPEMLVPPRGQASIELKGALDFGQWREGEVPLATGTVIDAHATSAELRLDVQARPEAGSHLRLSYPGVSSLRLTTRVPPLARGLIIKVHHTFGTRHTIRNNGEVTCRLSVVGKACEATLSVAPTGGYNYLGASETVVRGEEELEILLEYLFGNTTYWVRAIELEWINRWD